MTPQRLKFVIAGVVVLLVIAALGTLSVTSNRGAGGGGSRDEEDDPSGSRSRSGRFNATSNAASKSSAASKAVKPGTNNTAKPNDKSTTTAAIADALTTNALGETEAETRERERYEAAQRNAFKYRKLDPEKVKPTELGPAFEEAQQKYNVPKELLAALAYVETGGTHRDGGHTMEAGYGVMSLKESPLVDTAAEAAALIGKSKEDLFYDQKLNIMGAAATLRGYYEDALAAGVSESEAWYIAVSTYSGRPDQGLAGASADEVAGWLIKGFQADLNDGGGTFGVPPNPTNPLFLPKNWKLVGLNPPTKPGETPSPSMDPALMRPPQ